MNNENIPGVYYLLGIMETDAGFRLNPDNTFEFYYTYGASDRNGYGNWEISNDTLILSSDYSDKHGFIIESEMTTAEKNTIIRIKNFDAYFNKYTAVYAVSGENTEEQFVSKASNFIFKKNTIDKILISCQLFPDNIVTLLPADTAHNDYTLMVTHDLIMVHFNQVKMRINETGIYGNFPLMNLMYGKKEFAFLKQ